MPKAVLIGPPGAGKSSVGRQLAKLWECEIFDSDSEIERVSGKKIADIFIVGPTIVIHTIVQDHKRTGINSRLYIYLNILLNFCHH